MKDLAKNGFSLWCDFIEREFLEGQFRELINKGIICGATSNPSIFANAITKSKAYKSDIERLRGKSAKDIYENLAFRDIKRAAEILLPLYKSNSNNGFISIEIDPTLCDNVNMSIDEGRRIAKTINMPNVMIKVPLTQAGFEVIRALSKDNININATLAFSQSQVKDCLESIKGNAKVVISVFVSRFDRYIESKFNNKDSTPKLGIYNAMNCYNLIESYGLENVRALFASTGVKDDFISPSYYISNLALKNSVNTAPIETILAFMKLESCPIKEVESKLDSYLSSFDLEAISKELLDSGLNAFKESFEQMLKAI